MDARREPKVPPWVRRVARNHRAHDVWHLMDKKVSSTDASDHQNRFLIDKRIISECLLPAMSEAEKEAASLLNHPEVGRRRRVPDPPHDGERRPRRVGRNHGGLEVMVYDQRGWGCTLFLSRWDSSGGAVLKGSNYRAFRSHCLMEAGDNVEIWAFRDEDEKLCFVFGNKTVSTLFSL